MSWRTTAPKATDYYVGWLCAVEVEYVIAQEVLDERYPTPSHPADQNSYFCGRIGAHNVVITCLPSGRYGETSAAVCATHMHRSFPNISINLMVGIAGGAPSTKNDIRLGDIVVSKPTNGTGGVIKYDHGKTIQNYAFEVTGHLNSPAQALLTATQTLASMHRNSGHRINQTVDSILARKPRLLQDYSKPDVDVLYHPDYTHPREASGPCQQLCDTRYAVHRKARAYTQNQPMVHYGLIASGDNVMKDARARDALADKYGALCFETEKASLMNAFHYLVIRGICDYSDTHKNDIWQGYAAAVAAAYAKELLEIIDAREVPTAPEAGQPQHQGASGPSLAYTDIPVAIKGGEIQDCNYCQDWASWDFGIGCPQHCSQCRAEKKPGGFKKFFSGFARHDYWDRDEMCSIHIRQRDIREEEKHVKEMQRAAVAASQQAYQPEYSSSPVSFNLSFDSRSSNQKQNGRPCSPCNPSTGYPGVPTNTMWFKNALSVPSNSYAYSSQFSRPANVSSGPTNASSPGSVSRLTNISRPTNVSRPVNTFGSYNMSRPVNMPGTIGVSRPSNASRNGSTVTIGGRSTNAIGAGRKRN